MKQILAAAVILCAVLTSATAAPSLDELTRAFGQYLGHTLEIVSPDDGHHFLVKATGLERHGRDYALIFEVK